MASLTIRNVTITPLELKLIERFEASAGGGGGGHGGDPTGPHKDLGFLARLLRALSDLFTASHAYAPVLSEDDEPLDARDVSGVLAGPFETRTTDIRAADPGGREILRLTFQTPGTEHRYVVDLPPPGTGTGPGARPCSQVMRREPPDAPLDLTAVWAASGAQLTVFSSAALASWMRELRDEYPLSMLSIPGTHNSPTYHVALPSVRCQAVPVRTQLAHGVRFLDVRVSCSRASDHLALVHSAFPVALTGARWLADLLAECYAFLDANPSEVLLMSLKREGTGRGDDRLLSRHLHGRYCAGDDARRWFTEPRIPTLGEARGRIVLVRRFDIDDSLRGEHGGRGWGVDASSWPDNCADGTVGSGLIRVQDFYEVDQSTNIEKKIELARSHLERACQQTFAEFPISGPAPGAVPLPFYINFLSASNFFNASCWPEKIAAKVNPSIIEYLCMRHAEVGKGPAQLDVGDAGTGIVVTDWVGQDDDWDLIKCIVGWNARLQLKK